MLLESARVSAASASARFCAGADLIIRSGHILRDAMRRNRLTVDELLEALREQGISDLREVKYAVLETSGRAVPSCHERTASR